MIYEAKSVVDIDKLSNHSNKLENEHECSPKGMCEEVKDSGRGESGTQRPQGLALRPLITPLWIEREVMCVCYKFILLG